MKVREEMFDSTVSSSGVIKGFRDGLYYKRHELFKDNNFNVALNIYFDEFETVNPLGSKTGGHKIGGIYCTLRNLPHEFNAILENIHLVGLFYSMDAKIHGIEKILRPLIDDLKILETQGIKVGNVTVRGTIGAFLFDNLGGNMLYHLPECFNRTCFCRICTVSHEIAKTMTIEQEDLLRSEILNARCDDENYCRKVGQKKETIFDELRYFSEFECFSVDIGHDILEGVAQMEMKLFLKEIVEKRKLITLANLNDRVAKFSYGIIDIKTKPSRIEKTRLY